MEQPKAFRILPLACLATLVASMATTGGCADDASADVAFDDEATELADAITHPARFEIQLGDAAPVLASGRLTVVPGAAGRPDEGYFVRTDRSTMTQASHATLSGAFPGACADDGCDLDFSYDARRRGYVSVDGPGVFSIDVGSAASTSDSEWKYIAIRRFAAK